MGRDGVIEAWRVYVGNKANQRLQVYRPVSNQRYKLIGENEMPGEIDAGFQVISIKQSERIFCRKNDVIGWRHDGNSAIKYDNDGSGSVKEVSVNSIQVGDEIDFDGNSLGRAYSIEAYLAPKVSMAKLYSKSNFLGDTVVIDAPGCSSLTEAFIIKSVEVQCGYLISFYSDNICAQQAKIEAFADSRSVKNSRVWKSFSIEKVDIARDNVCGAQSMDEYVSMPRHVEKGFIGRSNGQGLDTVVHLQNLDPMTEYYVTALVYHTNSPDGKTYIRVADNK